MAQDKPRGSLVDADRLDSLPFPLRQWQHKLRARSSYSTQNTGVKCFHSCRAMARHYHCGMVAAVHSLRACELDRLKYAAWVNTNALNGVSLLRKSPARGHCEGSARPLRLRSGQAPQSNRSGDTRGETRIDCHGFASQRPCGSDCRPFAESILSESEGLRASAYLVARNDDVRTSSAFVLAIATALVLPITKSPSQADTCGTHAYARVFFQNRSGPTAQGRDRRPGRTSPCREAW